MYLLLSPAKNLDETTPAKDVATTLPALLAKSEQLITVLKQLDKDDIKDLMKVSDNIASLNVKRFNDWATPFDDHAKAAIYLFAGDAYKGLNASELSAKEIGYLNEHLGILSGLYGLLRPLDSILPYRLEMGTRLRINGYANLYEFWGDAITELLQHRMQAGGHNTLVNLASNEYFSAINTKQLTTPIVTPKFLDKKDGEYKIISFYAKRARGLMTRFCAVNALSDVNDLKGFDMEQYYFCDEKSSVTDWVFLRDMPY